MKKKWLKVGDIPEMLEEYARQKNIAFNEEGIGLCNLVKKDAKDKEITERKHIMNLRTHLMGYLINVALTNFIDNIEEIGNGGYGKELIEDDNNFDRIVSIALQALVISSSQRVVSD